MDFNAVSTSTIENSEKNDNFTFITIPIQNIDTISSDQLQSEYILKTLDDGSFILEGPQVPVAQIGEVNNYFDQQLLVDPKSNEILVTSNCIENDKFVCQYCNEKFSNKILLRKHEKGHIQEKPYKCEKCSASYNVLTNLQLHQMLCSNEDKTLKCPICNKIFSRFASLKSHLAIHQSDDQLFCPECEKPFDTQLQVDIHMKTHDKIRKYTWQCRLCKEEFSNQTSYRSHVAEHSKIRQLLSTLKTKSTGKRAGFKRNKIGRHVCMVCSKSFAKYSLLTRHSRVHSGEKPFKCKTCGSAFSQKNTLKIHMHKHTGTRPYKCSLCSAAFGQIGNLRVHIIRVHSLERNGNTFPCNECECIFRKLSTLNAHINRVHNNLPTENSSSPFNVIKEIMMLNKAMTSVNNDKSTDILQQAVENSAIQDTTSTQNSWDNSDNNKINKSQDTTVQVKNIKNENLSETTSATTNDIEIRPIALADRGPDGTLRRHVVYQRKVGNIRWHQCSYCPKEFKKPSDLVRHIRIHTNEKPYKCHICERSFTVKTTLTSHLRTHTNQKTKKPLRVQKENTICDGNGTAVDNSENSTEIKVNNQCPFCNKKIPNKKLLESHIKRHELKSNLNSNKSLLSNIQLHEPFYVTDKGTIESYVSPKNRIIYSEIRPHTCMQCNAAFRKMSHLKQHLRIHSNEKPFSCNICNRNFRSSGVLKNHKRSHDGIRPYSCKECNQVFSTSGSLQRHLLSHSTRRPFLCPYCHKSFKTFSNCRKHITTHKLDVAMSALQQDEESKATNEGINYTTDQNTQVISNEEVNVTSAENCINVSATQAINVINTLIADETGNVTLAELNTSNIPVDILLNVQESLDKNLMPTSESLDDIITETNVVSETLQSVDVENNNPINVVFTVSEENDNMLLEVSKQENTLNNFQEVTLATEAVTAPDFFISNKINNALEIVQDIPEASSNPNSILVPEIINFEDVNKVKKNQCTYCTKTFRKPSDLTRHIRTHTGERPFFCNICNKKFSLNSTLKSHLKIHGSITKDFVCTVCSKTFVTKGSLKVHMRLHTGLRPFPCDYCGLRFRTSGHKLAHHQAHLKEIERQKSDSNSKSSKNFRTKNKMRKLHDGIFVLENESNLNSDNVDNKLVNETDKNNGNQDLETIYFVQKQMEMENLSQLQENPINIAISPLDADVFKSLNSQECMDFNEIIVQSVDSQTLATNNECEITQNLIQSQDHNNFPNAEQEVQEKKMFLCGFCLKIFEKSSQLQRHLRIHTGERPFVCNFCNKSFNQKNALDRHLKTHLDHRPYECPHCEHKFTQKGNLKTHIQRTHESGKVTVDTLLAS